MKRLATAAVALGALVVPGAADAASYHGCGSYEVSSGRWTYGPTMGAVEASVRARSVSCRKARHIVRTYSRWSIWSHNATYSRIRFSRGAWTCFYQQRGYESTRTVCKAFGGRRIRWVSGA
jgi:hypothetical protein